MRGQELSEAYASADAFVMPSETETLGFVVLEAMASGVPVVAVAAGGLTDIITQPGTTGLLYEPGDYAAAARMVAGLVEDRAAAARLGAAGRAEVEKYGWSAATRNLRDKQYRRAVRVSNGRRRFWWLLLRNWLARGAQAMWAASFGLVLAMWRKLDYARDLRGPTVAA